jgi:putative addiction module component (TIGR02574 family)
MNTVLTAEINRLSQAEKLLLVEDLWDQIAAAPDNLSVPAAHREMLDRRLSADGGDAGRPWHEVRAELFRR